MQNLVNYTPGYYDRDIAEHWFKHHGLLRPDQLAAVCYTYGIPFWGTDEHEPRNRGKIISIGCGAGELEKWLEDRGEEVIGVDPSAGAKQLYKGKILVPLYPGGGKTIIFCESLEHIPREEIDRIWSLIPKGARVIIVNWPDYHPLMAEGGWDHITTINEALFDQLSEGFKVILRRNSHLVLER